MKKNIGARIGGVIFGIILAVVLLGAIACALSGLLMLGWNVVGVAALSIAVPITFLTALKGIGILYIIVFLVTAVQAYSQKMQFTMAMHAMRKFGEEMGKAEKGGKDEPPADLFRHFRPS